MPLTVVTAALKEQLTFSPLMTSDRRHRSAVFVAKNFYHLIVALVIAFATATLKCYCNAFAIAIIT